MIHRIYQSGGSPSGWSAVTIPQSPASIYSQQFNELDNVNNVLNRPVLPGNKFIAEMSPNDYDNNIAVLPKESMPDVKREKLSNGTKAIIEAKQPYFLDNALIVNYYGKTHYWDWRYPRQPIPIEFATDPDRFVKENPEEYPSYVIQSRRGIAAPNDPGSS
jgi:hypothetical protein